MNMKSKRPLIRAVGYSRTSGEGQRDNTSIPSQKAAIERFIESQGWQFVGHYVDESLTGAKIDGREEFQRMMRDAASDQFDVIVPWDVTRFSRDGCDIISNAKFLKTNFGVCVVDTKGQFDNRDSHRVLQNFVQAGVAEAERLSIMERCRNGAIARARAGLPWCPNPPAGRGFKRTGKNTGEWFITERGKELRRLLERYADGEPLQGLAQEYGFHPAVVVHIVHVSQLSGTYVVTFNSPEIGITDLRIPVPAVPQVITPELEQRVRDRLSHNRICNKACKRKYLLTGFVRCSHCGRSLTAGQSGKHYYYGHHTNQSRRARDRHCDYRSIRGDVLEEHVLDYLYGFFLDKPAYNEAIKAALPSNDDRQTLAKDIETTGRLLAAVDREIKNLANAVAAGADVGLLLSKQDQVKAEKQALAMRLNELTETLAAMPDPQYTEQKAAQLRLRLMQEYGGRDWRKLPYEEVRRFLHFLFGDNPSRSGNGIFVDHTKEVWRISLKGRVEFHHDVVNGRPLSHAFEIAAEAEGRSLEANHWISLWERYKKLELSQKRWGFPAEEEILEEIKRSEQALKELGFPMAHVEPVPIDLSDIKLEPVGAPKPLIDNGRPMVAANHLPASSITLYDYSVGERFLTMEKFFAPVRP